MPPRLARGRSGRYLAHGERRDHAALVGVVVDDEVVHLLGLDGLAQGLNPGRLGVRGADHDVVGVGLAGLAVGGLDEYGILRRA